MDEVTYTVNSYDDDGNITRSVEVSFQSEGYLVDYLANFQAFLQGCTFGYVENVIAIKDDGEEVGTE